MPHRHETHQQVPDAQAVLGLLHAVADAVAEVLGRVTDWGPSGDRVGQYAVDLLVDEVCVGLLLDAGFGVLSEESGLHATDRAVVVVVDPLDGSTNASQGVPWFGTSLCAMDLNGPWVALVADQSGPRRWSAIRGGGSWQNGERLTPSTCQHLDEAFIGLSGLPPGHLGWRQFRALGASALDLCLVASGVLDGFVDCSTDAHGVWDYAAGALICAEAGALVVDAFGRDLMMLDVDVRRTPIAASTPMLVEQLVAARRW